ncbi:MAG: ubiquinol-cytochrome c reductase iron-sulfur subunit [Chloroflexota bacterium]
MTTPRTTPPDMGESPAAGESMETWREALAARRTVAETNVPGALATRPDMEASRRSFIRGSFLGGLGLALLGSVGLFVDFLYPRGVRGFGGPVAAGKITDYKKGAEPKHFLDGQFYVTNLDPKETRAGGSGGGSGLIALWHKCPHLGCTVPWRPEFEYEGDKGWFRCPCHGSTYTKAGVRVFGPAPRPMDTMQIEVDAAGNVTVQTGARTSGGPDNPQRAKQFPGLPA